MYKIDFKDTILINGIDVKVKCENNFAKKIAYILSAKDIFLKEYNGYRTYGFYCFFCDIKFKFSITFFNSKQYGHPYLIYDGENDINISWTNDINILRKFTDNLANVLIEKKLNF